MNSSSRSPSRRLGFRRSCMWNSPIERKSSKNASTQQVFHNRRSISKSSMFYASFWRSKGEASRDLGFQRLNLGGRFSVWEMVLLVKDSWDYDWRHMRSSSSSPLFFGELLRLRIAWVLRLSWILIPSYCEFRFDTINSWKLARSGCWGVGSFKVWLGVAGQ